MRGTLRWLQLAEIRCDEAIEIDVGEIGHARSGFLRSVSSRSFCPALMLLRLQESRSARWRASVRLTLFAAQR